MLEMHNEGRRYKEVIENMYYLNDDFNDNHFHFSAALERYKINCEVIQERIKNIQQELERGKTTNGH